jgi:hypothetical protein
MEIQKFITYGQKDYYDQVVIIPPNFVFIKNCALGRILSLFSGVTRMRLVGKSLGDTPGAEWPPKWAFLSIKVCR